MAGERDSSGLWGGRVHTAIFKVDNQQGLIAHRTLLNIMWQPGWKESFRGNGYICMVEYLSVHLKGLQH